MASIAPSTRPLVNLKGGERQGFQKALSLFRKAAQRVPAYKDFLKKHGVKPALVKTKKDFAQLPLTDKPNYISRYSLQELSWDGTLDSSTLMSTSSGSTGTPFFWPRGVRQEAVVDAMFQRVFEEIFETKKGTTLFVDSFALGTWIAGLEAYSAAKWTTSQGNRMLIATPGIEKAEAVNQIKKLAPLFDKVVLAGYPPFVKDIVDQGAREGVRWKGFDTRLFLGGEAVSELWKSRMLQRIGKSGDVRSIVNVYGMADAGVAAHETPLCALVRECVPKNPDALSRLPPLDSTAGLYQYYPSARYFEVLEDKTLILTADAGLPLIRYDTRDTGGIVEADEVIASLGGRLQKATKRAHVNIDAWRLPFVYLYGRKDLSITFYALNIYVEHIKRALETSSREPVLSGLFIMEVQYDKALDQRLVITVELGFGVEPSRELSNALVRDVSSTLSRVNSEYAKLSSTMGARALPQVRLVRYGEMETRRGRKHKWIKRKRVSRTRAGSR